MIIPQHELSVYFDRYTVLVTHSKDNEYLTISNGEFVDDSEISKILYSTHGEAIAKTIDCVKRYYKESLVSFRKLPTLEVGMFEGVPYYICRCRILKL